MNFWQEIKEYEKKIYFITHKISNINMIISSEKINENFCLCKKKLN